MTRNEAAVIVDMIGTFYPNEYAKSSPEQMKFIVDMWAATCGAFSAKQVAEGLQKYVASDLSGFAPKPGQVIQHIVAAEDAADLTPGEAWSMVLRAASNGIYGADEEFEQLPPEIQRALGSSIILRELAMEDSASNSVTESHFKRQYSAEIATKRQLRRTPPSVFRIGENERKELEG